MTLLSIRGLTRRFGGLAAVSAVDLDVAEGEFLSIIGPNGAGKTTLFNLVTGFDVPDAGTVLLDGRDVTGLRAERLAGLGLTRTFQHNRAFGNLSVIDNVMMGAHARLRAVRPAVPVVGALVELVLALVRPPRVRAEEEALRAEASEIIAGFGERLTPRLDHKAHTLSYANRRRVEIGRALMSRPRVLLFDEPTAGMNPTETAEMLELIHGLKRGGLTVVLIEHKLDLVVRLSDRIVVLDHGAKIAEGVPAEVVRDPAVIEAYLGSREVGLAAPSPRVRGEVESRVSVTG